MSPSIEMHAPISAPDLESAYRTCTSSCSSQRGSDNGSLFGPVLDLQALDPYISMGLLRTGLSMPVMQFEHSTSILLVELIYIFIILYRVLSTFRPRLERDLLMELNSRVRAGGARVEF
jgi:hypothetical protein